MVTGFVTKTVITPLRWTYPLPYGVL